jgi:energy-coupling factor transporter ATP-binding protein EcfA2
MLPEPAPDQPHVTPSGVSEPAGARWWGLDIHAHSPASFDYGGLDGKLYEGERPSYEAWIRAYIDAGVDGIVITDHNSHEGIEVAHRALEALRADDASLRPFVIFPGVEITASGGFHVLAVFDPSADASVVDHTLVLCKYQGARGRSDETANMTVLDIAEVIAGQGGICIPAHADQRRGILGMDSRELLALKKSPHVQAVEVVDDARVADAGSNGWVSTLGSDAHHLTTDTCPEGEIAKAPGTHLTLFKAEMLNLDGLRLALTDSDESVHRVRVGYDDLNETLHGHVDQVELAHRGVTETYRFGPWMNCLVGGRGVGKSTVLELLRLALGRSDELEGTVASDLRRFSPDAVAHERWWTEDTRITVRYTQDRRHLRVVWSGAEPHKSHIEVQKGDLWEPQSGRASDRTPIRIFSQKQIYELATSPQTFLKILDDMPQVRRSEWTEDYEALQLRFKDQRNKLAKELADSKKAERIRGQLEEVRGRLSHLEELRASPQFRELETLESFTRRSVGTEERAQGAEETIVEVARSLRELANVDPEMDEYAERAASFVAAADLLDQASTRLQDARTNWQEDGSGDTWRERASVLNTWLNEQGGQSRVSPEQTQADRQHESDLDAELRGFEGLDDRCAEQQQSIDKFLKRLEEARQELHERRRSYTSQLSSSVDALTKVEVFHYGDIESLGEDLRRVLNCPESFDSAFATDGIPSFLNRYQRKDPRFSSKVRAFKDDLIDLVLNGLESKIGQAIKVDARFYGRLANADTFELITDIMLWFPEDLVAVSYRPAPKSNFVAVDQGSPGQKTAALLTVVLQMGSHPLLLDQPEDDLENKLIRHLAVETFKSIKSHRQLIVSTHNANVVVTSGAENVLVLRHGEFAPAIEAEGTLQQAAVKKEVCEILEGGEEAIKTRYRRLVGK